jgi:D-glycero-alpha-D-manno-heptose 1-phosphate guanylyltransferase
MQAIVLAGGSGTRLRAEVPGVPKPLAPIHGRPFLGHLLSYWVLQGVDSFILATGFGAEEIEGRLGPAWQGARITYSRERSPLGTGGAFLAALRLARPGQPMLLLNGDSWADLDLPRLLSFHAGHSAEVTVAAVRVDDGTRYGAIDREPGTSRITRIARGVRGPALIGCGAFLFSGEIASRLRADGPPAPLDLEGGLLPAILSRGHCHVFEHDGAFIDIGTPDDFRRAGTVMPRELR